VLQCSRGRRGEIKSSKACEGSVTLIKCLSFFFNVKNGDEIKWCGEREKREVQVDAKDTNVNICKGGQV
jgi:hypothetical protein